MCFSPSVRRAIVLGLSLASGSCKDDFNWCTEAKGEDFLRAEGEVTIHYEGKRAPDGSVKIVPYVRLIDGVLSIQGCGKRNGDLWRWRSGFARLQPGATDVPISAENEGALYGGEVRVCPNDDCSLWDNIVTVSAADPERWPATGSVHAYDPASGTFRASLQTTTQLGETTKIEVNIKWNTSDAGASGD